MATLTGKITDVTGKSPETISSITVKAPSARIGSGTDVIVSSPATVDFNRDTGDITVSGLTGGLSWLFIEGDGWSDSIALAVAEGMITLVEAIANAAGVPGMSDFIGLLVGLQNRVDEIAQDAVDAAAENIVWSKGLVADADAVIEAGAGHTNDSTLNLPGDRSSSLGALETLQVGSTFSQRWTSWTTPYEVYRRSKGVSGGWYEWENAADEPWDNLGLVADTEAVTSPGAGYTSTGTTANLPVDAGTGLGSIEYFQVASTLYARWTAWGLTPKIYTRSQRSDKSWYPWTEVTGGDDSSVPVARGTAGGLKTVPLALSTGHGNSSDGVASGSFRLPLNFAAPIVRWRLAFANRNPRYGNIHDTTATVSKVTLGNDEGGGKISTPVTVDTNIVVPANGDVAYTDWCSTPIDGAMLLGYKFTSTGSNTPPRLLGGGWDMGAADPASTTATGTRTSYVSFDMWIEAEVENGTPVIAAFGDSLTAGLHADVPVHDSWLSQYARGIGALPVHYAHSGDGANSWAGDLESYKWTRWAHLDLPDGVIYQLGSNDLTGDGDSVPALKANTATIVEHIAETITPNIYAGTIPPRNSWGTDTEAERTTYNAWLRTLPAGIRDVFDPAAAVGNGANLKDEYQTDGTHLNTAGYGAWAGAITRKIIATPKIDQAAVDSALEVKADKSYVDAELGGKAEASHTHDYSQISGKTTEVTADPNDAFKVLYLNYMGQFRVRTDSIINGTDVANREFALQQNWYRGTAPAATTSLSDLQDGAWGVASATVAQTLGIPNNALGTLQVVTISNGKTALYVTNDQRMFITSQSGGVWADWTQVGGATTEGVTQQELDIALSTKSDSSHTHDASEITGLGIRPPAPPSSTSLKIVPLALTLGQGGTSGAPVDGHYRVPMRYTAPITRWRLAIGNANPYYITTGPADLTIGAITVGEHAGGGAFTTAPTTVAEGVHIPSGARTITYTEWQDTPLGDGREMLLGFTYTSNNATAPPLLVGGSWKFDAATQATDVAPTGGVQSTVTPLDIWIEAETLGGTPVVAVVGDSTSCGVGATIPVYDSWLSVYCRQHGALPVHYANSGHTALDWNRYPEHYRINRWNHLPQPDAVIFALGNNDMGSDTPPMSERAMESYRIIRERIGDNVYAASVKPRASVDADQQQRRQDYISWLSGPGKELFRDAFDVNTPLGGDSLLPEYDSGDGAHLNSVGYEVYAGAVGRVVAPPLAYQQGGQDGL